MTGTLGVVALAAGLEGQCLRPATWLERGVFIAAALLLIHPGVATDVVGLLLLALALAVQKLRPATLSAPEGVRP